MTSNASILGTQLKIEHLSLLKDVLTSVSHKYFVLGSMMKVKHCMLVQISEDGCTSDEKLCNVLEHRLRQLPLLTWHDIVSALRSPAVHEQVLASQIESQYIPCSSSQSHPVSDQSSTIDATYLRL